MQNSIAVPPDVREEVERIARRDGRSESEIVTAALREYAARHGEVSPDGLRNEIDAALEAIGTDENEAFVRETARRVLKRTEW